jgi:hypothetical protein
MKTINALTIVLVLVLLSCKSVKQNAINEERSPYAIIESRVVSDQDTIIVDELRLYEIESALDATRLMYENYGSWEEKSEGKFQSNIKQMAWVNVKLFEDDRAFSVITDGAETDVSFFASLIIIDSNNRNCLSKGHPLREDIVQLMLNKLNALSNKNESYKLFR